MGMMLVNVLCAISLIVVTANGADIDVISKRSLASCYTSSSSYTAPFDLSSTDLLTVSSTYFSGGSYHIQPCGTVNSSICPYTSGQQTCFSTMTWELVGDGLGSPSAATWSPVDPSNWSLGVVSMNTDVATDYDQCNADPATNMVKTTYQCNKGDDTITVVIEPAADKNGPCRFEFVVDSSVVCNWSRQYSSSTGSGVPSTGAASTGSDESTGSSGGGADVDWPLIIAVAAVAVVCGVIVGVATTLYITRRNSANQQSNHIVFQQPSYAPASHGHHSEYVQALL